MGNSFNYYDLLCSNEGVSLIYGNNQWLVDDLIGLPKYYQLGKVYFLNVPEDKLPNGCLLADGSEVSRTTYRRLFDIIGVTYGAGDGTTTFKLPNQAGYFMRGTTSVVPLGRVQQDAMQKMTGQFFTVCWDKGVSSSVFKSISENHNLETSGSSMNSSAITYGFDNSLQARTAEETRSKNISYTPVIYFQLNYYIILLEIVWFQKTWIIILEQMN